MEQTSSSGVNKLVDHLFRHESVKMVAVLTKMLGIESLSVAEDIVQDTLIKAMRLWSLEGIPDNPPAWLYTVAKNKAIDFLRSSKTKNKIRLEAIDRAAGGDSLDAFAESEVQDSLLRMIFACCHPSIPEESQIAMSLKALCGLSVQEISKAFLTSDDTIAKRIYRAKEKLRQAKVALEVPTADVQPRLDVVLRVLYLTFNEGYNSSHRDELIRKDLCAEAMRLTHLLTQHHITNTPQANALLALMCFQSSRLHARVDASGAIITMKYQDRSQWNHQLIQKGRDYLDRAAEGNSFSVYHLEAAIAGLHSSAPSFEQTDWLTVHDLYEVLYSINPSPIVALNKAIASSYAVSNESALTLLRKIKGLEKHHLYHAALGEVLYSLGNLSEARLHFQTALNLTESKAEQQLLMSKMEKCSEEG